MNSLNGHIKGLFQRTGLGAWVIAFWLAIAIVGPVFVHEGEGILPALIPYDATTIDLSNANTVGPLDTQHLSSHYYRHWLGTDEIGRDILAQLIHGSRTALIVGLFSVLISAFLGILIGAIPAYLGDKSVKANTNWTIISTIYTLFIAVYLLFAYPWAYSSHLTNIAAVIFSFASVLLFWRRAISITRRSEKSSYLPFDLIAGRMIETMDSLPILFIIISLSAVIKPSIYGIVFIIGISNWASIARYARAEVLSLKKRPFIESARAIGMSNYRLFRKHILPNTLGPVMITLAFGVAAAILIEATLSFLGIGIGVEEASWGSMMTEARKSPEAWWLAIFPGAAIFLVVYSCNKLGESLRE